MYINLDRITIDPKIIHKISSATANIYRVVPVAFHNDILTVAMAESNSQYVADLALMLQCTVTVLLSQDDEIQRALEKYYPDHDAERFVSFFLNEVDTSDLAWQLRDKIFICDPIGRLLDLILWQAIQAQADEIRFIHLDNQCKLLFVIAGELSAQTPPPYHCLQFMIERIKRKSGLDTLEISRPQKSHTIERLINGVTMFFSVATVPTESGEDCTIYIHYPK